MTKPIGRREFIKRAAVSATAVAALGAGAAGCRMDRMPEGSPRLPRRPYGHGGPNLSVIGFGGLVISGLPQAQANRIVARAVGRGVNYFDVAPTYGDAEARLGPALKPYRSSCFLACKTTRRDAAGAKAELEQSLERLQTSFLDLYQLHALKDVAADVDPAFGKGGALETLVEARRAGLVRHLGFSAHSEEAALTAMDRFAFDSILFPVHFSSWYAGGFGARVVEAARARNVTILALKPLALRPWLPKSPLRERYSRCWYEPVTDPELVDLAVRFTLDQPVASALPPGDEELFWTAVDCAVGVRPLGEAERERLRAAAAGLEPLFRAPA